MGRVIALTLEELADVVGGTVVQAGDEGRVVDAVVIDSRLAAPGTLFVALPGEHTDGHRFVADAARRGAAGALVAHDRPLADAPGAVAVDDPADALLGLGAWLRDTVDPLVLAVTGSVGKTTTKDLLAAAVGAGREVVANPGSYNNELGVPLTLCRLEATTEVLVAEVGARGPGHIAALSSVLRPDVAVVTRVVGAHLEMLGSLEGVAAAKAELVAALDADGVAVLNADDPLVAAMAAAAPGRVVTFGLGAEADWRATDLVLDGEARATFTAVHPAGRTRVAVPLPGRHNAANALAALAAAAQVGLDPEVAAAGLAGATTSRWRMELGVTADGVTVLNDAYNANPASMLAALDALLALGVPGGRWAVLGAMAELGAGSGEDHRAVGAAAAARGLSGLVAVGAPALAAGAVEAGLATVLELPAGDPAAVAAAVKELVRAGDAVLVKASRAAGLERVAAALLGAS